MLLAVYLLHLLLGTLHSTTGTAISNETVLSEVTSWPRNINVSINHEAVTRRSLLNYTTLSQNGIAQDSVKTVDRTSNPAGKSKNTSVIRNNSTTLKTHLPGLGHNCTNYSLSASEYAISISSFSSWTLSTRDNSTNCTQFTYTLNVRI